MVRRSRTPDRHSAGKSSKVPFKHGESAKTRHRRRLGKNLSEEKIVRQWCTNNGFALRITNDGHHWQFVKNDFLAEWWPSSAKLVIDKQWHDGIHCHDHGQAIQIIENRCHDTQQIRKFS